MLQLVEGLETAHRKLNLFRSLKPGPHPGHDLYRWGGGMDSKLVAFTLGGRLGHANYSVGLRITLKFFVSFQLASQRWESIAKWSLKSL